MGKTHDCPFRPGGAVDCDTGWCDKCGWNPAVEEKRKKKIREKLKVDISCHTRPVV